MYRCSRNAHLHRECPFGHEVEAHLHAGSPTSRMWGCDRLKATTHIEGRKAGRSSTGHPAESRESTPLRSVKQWLQPSASFLKLCTGSAEHFWALRGIFAQVTRVRWPFIRFLSGGRCTCCKLQSTLYVFQHPLGHNADIIFFL